MAAVVFQTVEHMKPMIGKEVYVSDWLEISQERVNQFADATGDHQWIHVDVERANRESPFGAPVAHGYLTLSLLAKFGSESVTVVEKKSGVNYGLNKVRFMSPVKVGSRIRGKGTLLSVEMIPGGAQIIWQQTVEIEGQDKPACAAESISRYFF